MRKRLEPHFMQELHNVRARLTREWRRLPPAELLATLRQATERLRSKRLSLQKR